MKNKNNRQVVCGSHIKCYVISCKFCSFNNEIDSVGFWGECTRKEIMILPFATFDENLAVCKDYKNRD